MRRKLITIPIWYSYWTISFLEDAIVFITDTNENIYSIDFIRWIYAPWKKREQEEKIFNSIWENKPNNSSNT